MGCQAVLWNLQGLLGSGLFLLQHGLLLLRKEHQTGVSTYHASPGSVLSLDFSELKVFVGQLCGPSEAVRGK